MMVQSLAHINRIRPLPVNHDAIKIKTHVV